MTPPSATPVPIQNSDVPIPPRTPMTRFFPAPSSRTVPTSFGTAEPEWLAWLSGQAWPEVMFDIDRLVVVAAHPDDEILGAGGLVHAAASQGIDVVTICVSDGHAAHPGSPEQLANRRHLELDTASVLLGLDLPRWGGLHSGTLAQHPDCLDAMIRDTLDESPDVRNGVLAVWDHDGEADHEAVGRSAMRVAKPRGLQLWMYPIWLWYWAHPGDETIPWHRVQTVPVSSTVMAVKNAAARSFADQKRPRGPSDSPQPVLGTSITSHLLRGTEYVFG
ncbi:PIG-L family deacetylase [Gordonia otitidis]|uniref:PIG-L deacetylase family protein n=1 Tax=Gordonia otitidis TaxID=249058 RepID=UPI001D142297|nr:PIG-L deacetylase family protein [Gordonia otitidis]UEA60728.1 PIG-L family deacetylase [Gordonia otitidis]